MSQNQSFLVIIIGNMLTWILVWRCIRYSQLPLFMKYVSFGFALAFLVVLMFFETHYIDKKAKEAKLKEKQP